MTYGTIPPDTLQNPLLREDLLRVDWRYIAARQSTVDNHKDSFVDRLVKCYFHQTWAADLEMAAVVKLNQFYRLNLLALIIGGASDEIIADSVNSVPSVIQTYRKIYCDVIPTSSAFKKEKAIEDVTSSPKERKILQFSLAHGWEIYLRTCGKDGKLFADKYSKITLKALREQAMAIVQNRFAEQELAPTNSPLYTSDGLLKAVLAVEDEDDTKSTENEVTESVKQIAKFISAGENAATFTREKIEFYKPDNTNDTNRRENINRSTSGPE